MPTPVCPFCGQRCYVPLPEATPFYYLPAFVNHELLATCEAGRAFERQACGYDLADILAAIEVEEILNTHA